MNRLLWIADLSQPDPMDTAYNSRCRNVHFGFAMNAGFIRRIRRLPMTRWQVCMKMMKYIFPVMILWMARSFPSGLALVLGSEPDHADRLQYPSWLLSVRRLKREAEEKRLIEKARKNKSQCMILEEISEMDYSEKWGVDVEEAVKLALMDLKLSRDEVEVTVLEEPSKGFFGIGSKLAKVRVEKKKPAVEEKPAEPVKKEKLEQKKSEKAENPVSGGPETGSENRRKTSQ